MSHYVLTESAFALPPVLLTMHFHQWLNSAILDKIVEKMFMALSQAKPCKTSHYISPCSPNQCLIAGGSHLFPGDKHHCRQGRVSLIKPCVVGIKLPGKRQLLNRFSPRLLFDYQFSLPSNPRPLGGFEDVQIKLGWIHLEPKHSN